tara:strand:+ start:1944 stop:2405 length:462 start_codon:yes stop_codon:yes gene_type:complete
MNIFVLDRCPKKAAQMACDKHVIKMILETAQMLCTVASNHGFKMRYRPTHHKHPCTLWAGKSQQNWNWLIAHGIALSQEYTVRYNKRHKSQNVIEACGRLKLPIEKLGLLPFAQAMPSQYRDPDPVTAYQAYYHGEKAGFATWKTQTPKWWRA